jgi:hypothetical protein
VPFSIASGLVGRLLSLTGRCCRFLTGERPREPPAGPRGALPEVRPGGPLAATGSGHGLTGLRERAALAGGTLTAGPADGEWQVCLRIPA